jgi:hypothetical protein
VTEPMTDARLDEIEQLAAAATPDVVLEVEPNSHGRPDLARLWSPSLDDYSADFFSNTADAEFMVAAVTAVPELIAEVRRLRAEAAATRAGTFEFIAQMHEKDGLPMSAGLVRAQLELEAQDRAQLAAKEA